MCCLCLQGVTDTHGQAGALAGAERIKNQRHIRCVVVLQTIENQRQIILIMQVAHQGLQVGVVAPGPQGGVQVFELAIFFKKGQVLAHVFVLHGNVLAVPLRAQCPFLILSHTGTIRQSGDRGEKSVVCRCLWRFLRGC
jgi:hypothetical protein